MKAAGMTCGIGSMLVGARNAGFDVVGNIEWRRYYHTGTFEMNFPDAFMVHDRAGLGDMMAAEIAGIDLIMGHPECGNFSNLRINKTGALDDPGDIPLFVDAIRDIRPRFFVMDDLPKSFIAFPMSEYQKRLPDYDLFPEWVSNHHYGNVQKHRKRMFMIGSLRDERWTFRSGERENTRTLEDELEDLADTSRPTNQTNHHPHVMDIGTGRAYSLETTRQGYRATWAELRDYFAQYRDGHIMRYIGADGEVKTRIGLCKTHWKSHSHVLTGTNPILHPLRNDPFTIRERARIQGFPDDFVFVGEVLEEDGTWNHDRNNHLVKQTGKAMPVQFCEYAARQVAAHICGEAFSLATDRRMIARNDYVDNAKAWYCENVGYSDQESACRACWLYDECSIRARKYKIGEPLVGQRDMFDPGVVPEHLPKKKKKMARPKVQGPPKPPRVSRRDRLRAELPPPEFQPPITSENMS